VADHDGLLAGLEVLRELAFRYEWNENFTEENGCSTVGERLA